MGGCAFGRGKQETGDRSQETEIRSQEVWNCCAIWLKRAGFAQGEGKIRVFFEAFLNDFERFLQKLRRFERFFQKTMQF